MTLSVTSAKSWPLATIWVPTRTAELAAWKRRRTPRCPSPLAAESESSRNTGSGASISAISSSMRSLPAPNRESVTEPQSGHWDGSRSRWPQ